MTAVQTDREAALDRLTDRACHEILRVMVLEARAGGSGYASVRVTPGGDVYPHRSPSWECDEAMFHRRVPYTLVVWERSVPHNAAPLEVFAWVEREGGAYVGDPQSRVYFRAADRSASWVADRIASGWVQFDFDRGRFANPDDHLNRAEVRSRVAAWLDENYWPDG